MRTLIIVRPRSKSIKTASRIDASDIDRGIEKKIGETAQHRGALAIFW